MRRRLLIAGTAAAFAAAVLGLGGALRSNGAAAPERHVDAARLASGFAVGDTEGLVRQLQDGLRASPNNVRGLGLLGLAYQQRARETGDPAWYVKSGGVLRRALRLAPKDLVATTGLGSLELSRHRFAEALALGRRAVAISPSTAAGYGVVGDALVELGRYDDAFRAFDRLASLKPGLAAYARVSYARELRGDREGAIEAMRLAGTAAIGQREPTAWVQVQLGKLEWNRGRYGRAAAYYRAALRTQPGYVQALDALAQVEGARGRYAHAIALERRAQQTIPLPQFAGFLGDLQRAAGMPREARQRYGLVGVIDRLLRAACRRHAGDRRGSRRTAAAGSSAGHAVRARLRACSGRARPRPARARQAPARSRAACGGRRGSRPLQRRSGRGSTRACRAEPGPTRSAPAAR